MKKIMSIVFVSALLSSISGCAKQSTEGADQPVNLVLYNNKIETVEALQKTADKFHEKYPNITVTVDTTQSEQYATSLKTKYASGEAPDIFMVTGKEDMMLWLEKLEDLSGEAWVNDMVEISKADITNQGKIYGFPVGIEGYGYMYRKDLFEQAGIANAPKNMMELQDAVDRLKEQGVIPFVNTWGAWYQSGMFYMNAAIAQQEDPYAFIEGLNNGEELIVGNPIFKDLAAMVKVDYDNCESPLNTDFSTQVAKFGNGTAAMACGGTWNQPTLDDVHADMPVGLLPMPFMQQEQDNDVLYAGVTTYWVVNKDSKAKDAAKAFLDWLVYDEEGQACLVTEMKNIPAFKNITAGTESLGTLGQTLMEYLEQGKVKGIYNSRYPAGTVQLFGTSLQKFAAGNITEDELLKELQDAWINSRQ